MTSPDPIDAVLKTAKRVCLFAHYHHLGLAAGYMLYYLDALKAAGFVTVVVSTATMTRAEADRIRAHCHVLIERENSGLDFGGWAEALRRYPDIEPDLLLLTNDSIYGPITDLSTFIDRLIAVPADFYGAVESLQHERHVQSWFVLLRPSAYKSAGFRRVLGAAPRTGLTRDDVIAMHEVGLTRALRQDGLVGHVPFSPAGRGRLGARWPTNPMQLMWRPLVERYGIPFVKVELFRSNPSGVDAADALAVVEQRNPALAELIRDDQRERAFGTSQSPRFYWRRAQDRLVRDVDLVPGSPASLFNAVVFHFWWQVVRTARVARSVAGFVRERHRDRSSR